MHDLPCDRSGRRRKALLSYRCTGYRDGYGDMAVSVAATRRSALSDRSIEEMIHGDVRNGCISMYLPVSPCISMQSLYLPLHPCLLRPEYDHAGPSSDDASPPPSTQTSQQAARFATSAFAVRQSPLPKPGSPRGRLGCPPLSPREMAQHALDHNLSPRPRFVSALPRRYLTSSLPARRVSPPRTPRGIPRALHELAEAESMLMRPATSGLETAGRAMSPVPLLRESLSR